MEENADLGVAGVLGRLAQPAFDLGCLRIRQPNCPGILLKQAQQQLGCFVLALIRQRPELRDGLFKQLGHDDRLARRWMLREWTAIPDLATHILVAMRGCAVADNSLTAAELDGSLAGLDSLQSGD